MRSCPACGEKSISPAALVTRRQVFCPKCETRVEIRPVFTLAVLLPLFVLGLPKSIRVLYWPWRLIVVAGVFSAFIAALAIFAPIESYQGSLGRIGLNGRRAGSFFWILIGCAIAATAALLVWQYRYGH